MPNIFQTANDFVTNKVMTPMSQVSGKIGTFEDSKMGRALFNLTGSLGAPQKMGTNLSSSTAGIAGGLKMGSKVLESIPGIGGFAKAGNALTGIMNTVGLGNDGVTKVDAIMGSTPLGFLNFGVGKTNKFGIDQEANSTGAFTGSTVANKKASDVAGKKVGWMSIGAKKGLNTQIEDARFNQNKMGDIVSANKDLLSAQGTMSQDLSLSNQLKKQGGFNPIAVGKKGIKLDKSDAQKILSRRGQSKASTETQPSEQSFIPGGALHAHRHDLKSHDSNLASSVTAKGVPVVTFEDGGEIEQHAEIERGEIIFRLEITEQLEKLWKDGSEEAMIEAGKLIAEEVVNNTKDKSGEYEIND